TKIKFTRPRPPPAVWRGRRRASRPTMKGRPPRRRRNRIFDLMRTAERPLSSRPPRHPLEGIAILQIIPSLEGGGSERSVIEHVEALAEVGAHPLVATQGGRLIGEMQAKGGV